MKKSFLTIVTLLGVAFTFTISAQFKNPLEEQNFTYSERNIKKYIQKAGDTKQERINYAFENVTGEGLRQAFCPYFADLYLGKNLDKVNQELLEILTTEDPDIQQKFRMNDHWCLAINQQFYYLYYAFGSKSKRFPGRLYPKTEKTLSSAATKTKPLFFMFIT